MSNPQYGTELCAVNMLVSEAADAIDGLSAVESAAMAALFSQDKLPLYESSSTNPEAGNALARLESGQRGVNCKARASLVHAVLTENMRLYPVIASTYIAEYGSEHYFNVALDVDTGEIVIVDNGKTRTKEQLEEGTHELITDPRSVYNAKPETFAALFEVAATSTLFLYANPLENSTNLLVPYLEVPTHGDDYVTDVRFHVLPENAPTEEDFEKYRITRLKDTEVSVLNNDASNRLVDRFTKLSMRSAA